MTITPLRREKAKWLSWASGLTLLLALGAFRVLCLVVPTAHRRSGTSRGR